VAGCQLLLVNTGCLAQLQSLRNTAVPGSDGLLPAREAAAPHGLTLVVQIGAGALRLTWVPLQPRRLGLAVLPRLWVRFEFEHLPDPQRHAFMKRFDLYTQRGGG
jgi:hypothetical protein